MHCDLGVHKIQILVLKRVWSTYFDFCQFCVVFLICFFFIPTTTANDLRLSKDFYTKSYPLHYCLILILEKEPVFPFSILSAKQGNYLYHVHNVFGMTRSMTVD